MVKLILAGFALVFIGNLIIAIYREIRELRNKRKKIGSFLDNIEIVKDFNLPGFLKNLGLIALYDEAADQNIVFRVYIDKGKKDRNYWLSCSHCKMILIPFDPGRRKIVPNDIWSIKINLAHEMAHIRYSHSKVNCKIYLRALEKKRYASCLYHEMVAWLGGWEILSRIGLINSSEIQLYSEEATYVLMNQSVECFELLKKKPDQCLYRTEIEKFLGNKIFQFPSK